MLSTVDDLVLKSFRGLKAYVTFVSRTSQLPMQVCVVCKEIVISKYLYLDGSLISDAGVKDLAHFKHLLQLDLCDTNVTDAGLLELRNVKSLDYLNIGGRTRSKITGVGLKALKKVKSLHSLVLIGSQITDGELQELITALANLQSLLLCDTNKITTAGVHEHQKACTKLTINGSPPFPR